MLIQQNTKLYSAIACKFKLTLIDITHRQPTIGRLKTKKNTLCNRHNPIEKMVPKQCYPPKKKGYLTLTISMTENGTKIIYLVRY